MSELEVAKLKAWLSLADERDQLRVQAEAALRAEVAALRTERDTLVGLLRRLTPAPEWECLLTDAGDFCQTHEYEAPCPVPLARAAIAAAAKEGA